MIKKEYEILKVFVIKPWKKFSFKEIKELSKKKSESYIYNTLKKYVKHEILKEEKAGNVILYLLNLDYEKTLSYLGFIAEYIAWNEKHIPFNDISRIMHKIPTNFFILLITGSYANNTQKKNSDIDIVIICDNSFEPKKIYSELKHESEMNIPPIHLYVFRENEFIAMLLDDNDNYGKEIANNNLILTGGSEYYKVISKAVKNGFVNKNIS